MRPRTESDWAHHHGVRSLLQARVCQKRSHPGRRMLGPDRRIPARRSPHRSSPGGSTGGRHRAPKRYRSLWEQSPNRYAWNLAAQRQRARMRWASRIRTARRPPDASRPSSRVGIPRRCARPACGIERLERPGDQRLSRHINQQLAAGFPNRVPDPPATMMAQPRARVLYPCIPLHAKRRKAAPPRPRYRVTVRAFRHACARASPREWQGCSRQNFPGDRGPS